jgi:DMSO reductase anchor subunit
MHPAYSVILFTTASGAGYGLLVWLALFGALGLVPAERWLGLVAFALALGLVTVGLLASTFHLGHPERAWRAFSQWRTSWLSREGVAAVATYVPAGLLALAWVVLEDAGGLAMVLALLTVAGAVVTVYCTGMIYASLRTIRQWHQPLVPIVYIALALATGAVLLTFLLHLFGVAGSWAALLAAALLLAGAVLKLAYWHRIDEAPARYTVGAATGLGALGQVRVLEPAHTRPNFVMREMGYAVGRKHAKALRLLALAFGFAVPFVAVLVTLLPGAGAGGGLVAVLSAALGVAIERWLFFAEAQHVVTVYYGASAA